MSPLGHLRPSCTIALTTAYPLLASVLSGNGDGRRGPLPDTPAKHMFGEYRFPRSAPRDGLSANQPQGIKDMTAGVHRRARRRGCMAARRARAAVGHAGNRDSSAPKHLICAASRRAMAMKSIRASRTA